MNKTFDSCTFGDSKSAIVLADLVSQEDLYKRRKISRMFGQITKKFRILGESIENLYFRKEMILLYRDHKFRIIDSSNLYSPKIKTYMKNVLIFHSRKYIDL